VATDLVPDISDAIEKENRSFQKKILRVSKTGRIFHHLKIVSAAR
jgi:hypothetical protein